MTEPTEPNLTLFEEFAYRIGYRKLKDNISILPHPLICWGMIVFFVDVVVLQALKEFEGHQATFLINPIWLIQPVLGLLAPFVVVYLYGRYTEVLENIDVESRTSDPVVFDSLVPRRLRIGLYIILISYSVYQFIFNIGVGTITDIGGMSELVGVTILLPLGYGILFSEFLATYVGHIGDIPEKNKKNGFQDQLSRS